MGVPSKKIFPIPVNETIDYVNKYMNTKNLFATNLQMYVRRPYERLHVLSKR